jgi:hypothetical protein
MSLNKLSKIFNRAVRSPGHCIATGVLGVGILTGTLVMTAQPYEVRTPVTVTAAQSEEAAAKANGIITEMRRAWYKNNLTATAIRTTHRQIGEGGLPQPAQFEALRRAQDQLEQDLQQQRERYVQLRQELLFNPALSERAAKDIYKQIHQERYYNTDNAIYFHNFGDQLAFRDEMIARTGLPLDPAKNSTAAADRLVKQMDDRESRHNWLRGISAIGAATGFMGLGLWGLGFRRPENEDTPAAAPEPVAPEAVAEDPPLLAPPAPAVKKFNL